MSVATVYNLLKLDNTMFLSDNGQEPETGLIETFAILVKPLNSGMLMTTVPVSRFELTNTDCHTSKAWQFPHHIAAHRSTGSPLPIGMPREVEQRVGGVHQTRHADLTPLSNYNRGFSRGSWFQDLFASCLMPHPAIFSLHDDDM